MKVIALFLSVVLLSACGSSLKKRNTLHKEDKPLERAQEISGGDIIGVRDNTVKVQRKVFLAEELRLLENEVYAMENEVYGNRQFGNRGLYGVYVDCMTEVNSVALGGTGKLSPIEPPAPVIREDREMKFVLDNQGDLVGVSEEYLTERIDRFKKYREVLGKRRAEYEVKNRICQNDVKNAKARIAQEKKSKEE